MDPPLMCDDAYLPLLKETVRRAKAGNFGLDLEKLPVSAEIIFNSYRNTQSTESRHELGTLLLLSKGGQRIIANNLAIIVESDLRDITSLPISLSKQIQIYLLERALSRSLPNGMILLDISLRNGIDMPPFELLADLGIENAENEFKNIALLSRIIFPYSPRSSLIFGEIAEIESRCTLDNFEACLEQIKSLSLEKPEYWVEAEHFVMRDQITRFLQAEPAIQWEVTEELRRSPPELLTPQILNGALLLIKSASSDATVKARICDMGGSLPPFDTLDSDFLSFLTEICDQKLAVLWPIAGAAITLTIIAYAVYRRHRSPPDEEEINILSLDQLTHLSESYWGEKEDLLSFFGITENCTIHELNRSFRNLAKIFHPDSSTGNESTYLELRNKYDRVRIFIGNSRQ